MVGTTILTDAESAFLNMLNRLDGSRQNVVALYLKLSALSPANKTPQKIKQVADRFREEAAKSGQAAVFVLSNQDVAAIVRNILPETLDDLTRQVRQAFHGDRALYDSSIDLIRRYYLEQDYAEIKALAEQREEDARRREKTVRAAKTVPLAPEHLDAILRNIQGFNILRLIRRQEAVHLGANGEFSGLFLEYFTSMADLKKNIAPDVDVLSNRWLFQYLSETLDERMLGISRDLFDHTTKKISLNLNISTLFTPMFEDFLDDMPENLKMVVEVRLMDVMQNPEHFKTARDLLHETGNEILIDGLSPIAFDFVDFNLFKPDYLKLNWPFGGLGADDEAALKKMTESFDAGKVILMRVEDEESLKWGLTHGITKFQGYFIDSLSAAVCRNGCRFRTDCPLTQCVACKARIAGAVRVKCRNPSRIDRSFEDNLKE